MKVSTKLSDYEEDEIKFVTQSLSYSGNTIIVKGYTVNTMGADLAYPFYAYASYPGKLLYQYRYPANKVVKKGIHNGASAEGTIQRPDAPFLRESGRRAERSRPVRAKTFRSGNAYEKNGSFCDGNGFGMYQ